MKMEPLVREMRALAEELGRPVRFMEVCGTHTMAAFRTGLRSLLPPNVSLLSGPGCPVCVTPDAYLDRAIAIASLPGTRVATFGDLLRVPGTASSLEEARARGAGIRIVYSPSDALELARREPRARVVFLGIGFETTAPAVAWTLGEAQRTKTGNYAVLAANRKIPPAMTALLSGGEVAVDGFLCPGHVSVITGSRAFEPICDRFRVPCVIAGFEAADMARAVVLLLRQLRAGTARVEIQYTRSVSRDGNPGAQAACRDVFVDVDAEWRGLGILPRSGYGIRETLAEHDADILFADLELPEPSAARGCICGDVLRAARQPSDCALFGTRCTPAAPVGPCMVSGEGACAAAYRYGTR
jgi:hydrogenase expression/formation protein HypD